MSAVRERELGPASEPAKTGWLRGLCWAVATLAWLGAVAVGLAVLWRYQRGAGAAAVSSSRWPSDSALPRAHDRPTVVQFIHPRCACSRASLAALRSVVAQQPVPPAVLILFLRPPSLTDDWARTENWQTAGDIPGAQRIVDRDGREAARFGARTSGQTFVYAADGTLAFAGGITPARGDEGDSAGRHHLLQALAAPGPTPSSRVFGCPLGDPQQVRR